MNRNDEWVVIDLQKLPHVCTDPLFYCVSLCNRSMKKAFRILFINALQSILYHITK